MRAKGTPHYTQTTVAWPDHPRIIARLVDEINVSFDSRDGGHEFAFRWIDLRDGNPKGALRLETFDFEGLLDERILRILHRVRRTTHEVSPALLVEWLEEEKIGPSHYHLRGLLEAGRYDSYSERMKLEERMQKLREADGG